MQKGDGSKPRTDLANTQVQPSGPIIFSRTIEDLERLLNDALLIARAAADEHEPDVRVGSPDPMDTSAKQHNSPKTLDVGYKSSAAEPRVSNVLQQDWAQPGLRRRSLQQSEVPKKLVAPDPDSVSLKEPLHHILRRKASWQNLPRKDDVNDPVRPQIPPRRLSRSSPTQSKQLEGNDGDHGAKVETEKPCNTNDATGVSPSAPSPVNDVNTIDRFHEMFGLRSSHASSDPSAQAHSKHINLDGCRHVDIKASHDFNVHETWRRQTIARDWTVSRKRFAATIACVNTSLIGITIGIYAGEVPAIQYVIVDLGHFAILGNVVLYLGLAIPTLLLWPLPLMHGRKPYTVMALAVTLCLQIPQGVAVSDFRSPYTDSYRKILLLSRALSGFALGFVNINLQATLLDLFGASLQSGNPHQELVDPYDVRRHGGGMGLWLGLWSWCSVGSISVGFFIGTVIVEVADVSWGFWTSLILMMVVLLLNIVGPEVRRSAYRRMMAEMTGDGGHTCRVSRGEVKMHVKSAGPYWWGEEVKAGMELCWKMCQQPGFAILAIYIGWAYAHFTLILMVCVFWPRTLHALTG